MRNLCARKLQYCAIVLLIFLIQSPVSPPGFAQDFYPLHVGDIWQYKTYSQAQFAGYSTATITKDTVMPNGKRYFFFAVEPFAGYLVRMDDSLISYRYDASDLDSDTSTTELIMDRFNEAVGTAWQSFRMPLRDGQIAKMEDSYSTVWFDELIEVRRISYTKPSGLWLADGYYSKKHGLIYTVREGDSQFELSGARMGGTAYGVITDATDKVQKVLVSLTVADPYPNPFNSSTTLEYSLSEESTVSIRVYGILGNLAKTVKEANESPGRHLFRWNLLDDSGNKLPSGVYFLRVDNGRHFILKKVIALQ